MPQSAQKLVSIFDLPKNRVYIGINNKLMKFILYKIKLSSSINKFRIKNKISFSLYNWIRRKEFPFIELLRIFKFLDINKFQIEKNFQYIKTGRFPPRKKSSGNLSPPLYVKSPIFLSKEFVRITAHLFADGCVSIDKNGTLTAAYYNQAGELRRQFEKDVSKVFNVGQLKKGINKTTPYLYIPSTVSLILLQIVPSFKSNECRIPIFIKNATKDLKKEFIRAFFDDEASVHFRPPARQIELTINNEKILEEIKEILYEFSINTSKIIKRKMRRFKIFSFYIRNFNNIFKFSKHIGFSNNRKKKNLINIIKNPGRISYAHGETKTKILDLLRNKKMTIINLSKILNRDNSTIDTFLLRLKKQNLVERKYLNKVLYWSLK